MSVDALSIFWRFQALAISPPPMMAMIPRIATTANSSTRLNPLRERGRSTLRRGRTSGRVTLIMQNPPFLKRGPCRNPVLIAKRLLAAILHPVLSRPTAPVASVDSTLFVTPAARPRTILGPRARGRSATIGGHGDGLMVLEKLRGPPPEPALVAQLRDHKWTSEEQKRELLEKFHAIVKPDVEWIVWTGLEQVPEIRAAGLAILKRRHDRAGLEALVPLLKTRSEAVRRVVMRFLKELAGPQLGPFLQEIGSRGDDFARLAALELARAHV